jgi:hypothetical protein
VKPSSLPLRPRTTAEWIRFWFGTSCALDSALVWKEFPVRMLSGGRDSFHWSYGLVLFLAAVSLFGASVRMGRSRPWLAILGGLWAIASIAYLAQPVY